MPESTFHAVVLRRRDLGESDRLLTLLTQEAGVQEVVARGARKGGSRLAGASEPLSVSVLSVATGRRLGYVTQSQPITSFPGLRADFDRLSFALALGELAAAVLPHEKEAAEEFEFLVRALKFLEVHEKPLVAQLWAEVQLLGLAGFAPSLDGCVISGEPLGEAEVWLSPHAGGYLSPGSAGAFSDRFLVRAEVVYVLKALRERELPPPTARFAAECLAALTPFWRAYAERPLAAREGLLNLIRPTG